MSNDKDPELTPEQEAIVGQFVGQLNAGSSAEPALATPVGLVRITPEQHAKIQEAAVEKTIQTIKKDPPTFGAKLIRDVSGISFAAVVLSGAAYVVYAAVRAIFG